MEHGLHVRHGVGSSVCLRVLLDLLTLRGYCRFGGGSELLRDGDDANVWKVLDEGMAYVSLLACVVYQHTQR